MTPFSTSRELPIPVGSVPGGNMDKTGQAFPVQTLPPFEVLIKWLDYYRQVTGEWPLPGTPPVIKKGNPGFPAPFELALVKPRREKVKAVDNKTWQKDRKPATLHNQKVTVANSLAEVGRKPNPGFSRFNYTHSVYYRTGVELIEKVTGRDNPGEINEGSRQALALILAWCHHPLFAGEKKRGAENKSWMCLPLNRCALELNMRAASFQQYIQQLQELKLITSGRIDSGLVPEAEIKRVKAALEKTTRQEGNPGRDGLSSRTFQVKSTVYQVLPEVLNGIELPLFNPAENSGITISARKAFPVEILAEVPGPGAGGGCSQTAKPLNKFFPGSSQKESSCHEVNKDLKNNKDKHEFSGIPSGINGFPENENLDEQQKKKLAFLLELAKFDQFNLKDSRAVLDSQEAQKFALAKELNLVDLERIYAAVIKICRKEGSQVKNPIGLFHRLLERETTSKQAGNRGKETGSTGKEGISYPAALALPGASPSPEVLPFQSGTGDSEPDGSGEAARERGEFGKFEKGFSNEIWEKVVEDLELRFRLSSGLVKPLKQGYLRLKEPNLAELVLATPLDLQQLDISTISTIKIAFSQRVGSTIKLEI